MPATASVRPLSATVTAKVLSKMRCEAAFSPRWSLTRASGKAARSSAASPAAAAGSARTPIRPRSRPGQRPARASAATITCAAGLP